MTDQQCVAIVVSRLESWGEVLVQAHATPLALLAVGHDHAKGQLHICRPEGGPSDAEIAAMFRSAADRLESGRILADNIDPWGDR